jgi:maltooligosyltrehalose trehalohydrolase
MTTNGDGFFTQTDGSAVAGLRYAFQLSGGQLRPDPASRWQPEGVHEPSALFFPDEFPWTDHDWRGVPGESLVIYEMHVGTFTPAGTFEAVIARLPELVELGVTAIEIMPVSQFPGDRNWGYDGVHPFAAQNTYGGPVNLQRVVDAAHATGLAVLLDVVYNHLGPEGNYLSEFGPYFIERHHTPWGAAINFDGPDCDPVRRYFVDNASYWIRDFHFDGLRLDAVQTMIDDSPRHILEEIQIAVQEVAGQQQRHVHVIGETNQNDSRLTNPRTAGGYQLDGIWADDLHHSLHALLTGESDGYYTYFGQTEHVAKVWERSLAYDGCYSRFRRRRHGNSAATTPPARFVVGLQNHDQVGNRFDSKRFSLLASPPQQRMAAAMILLSPFTPLLFMGEEYGETAPFPFFCSFLNRSLNRAVDRGRQRDLEAAGFLPRAGTMAASAKKTYARAVLSWRWRDDPGRAGLRRIYRTLLAARKIWPPLRQHLPPSCELAETGLLTVFYAAAPAYCVTVNFGSSPQRLGRLRLTGDSVMLFSTEFTNVGGAREIDDSSSPLAPFELAVWGPESWFLPDLD